MVDADSDADSDARHRHKLEQFIIEGELQVRLCKNRNHARRK